MKLLPLVFLLTTVLLSETVFAGAWTRKQHTLYSKLSFSTLSTNTFYTRDGGKLTTADFRTWSTDIYGEYGVLDRLTAIAKIPILKSASFETTGSKAGIGDVGIGFRYGIISQTSTPVAITTFFEFPSGDENGLASLNDGSGVVRLPTGDGEFNTRIVASISHSFHPVPAFISVDAGYNIRTEGFTNEYMFGLQAGYKPAPGFWIQGILQALGPVGRTNPDLQGGGVRLGLGEGVQYTAYGFGVAYEIVENVSLSFDYHSAFGKTTNIYSGANLIAGISYER